MTFPTLSGGCCFFFFFGRSCSVVNGVKVGGREKREFWGGGLLLRLIFLSGFFKAASHITLPALVGQRRGEKEAPVNNTNEQSQPLY